MQLISQGYCLFALFIPFSSPTFFPQHFFFTITSNELHNIRFAIIPWLSLLYVVYPTIDTFQNGLCLHPT